MPKSVETRRNSLQPNHPFALNGWDYSAQALNGFIDTLASRTSTGADTYRDLLSRGGGKAFGLAVSEVLADRFKSSRYRMSVPAWRVIGTLTEQDVEFSLNVLRSSDYTEDWLNPDSGTFRSYDLYDLYSNSSLRERVKSGDLPKIPYILQERADGLGVVVDIGHSSVLDKTAARIACGNERHIDGQKTGWFTSATDDSEASVITLDANTGDVKTPFREFYHYNPRFMQTLGPEANFVQPLLAALQDIGVNFGVQLELVTHPDNPTNLSLVQIRPTPAQVYHRIKTRSSKGPIESERRVTHSAVVNGAFEHIGEPEFFRRVNIQKIGRKPGRVAVFLSNMPFNNGSSISKPYEAARVFKEVNDRGYDLQLTPYAIKPNTKHGQDYNNADKEIYDQLDNKCGMVSLTKPEVEELREVIATQGGKVKVISDGLVASVSVVN